MTTDLATLVLMTGALGGCGAGTVPREQADADRQPTNGEQPNGSTSSESHSPSPTTSPTSSSPVSPFPTLVPTVVDTALALGPNPKPWEPRDEALPLEAFAEAFISAACQLVIDCPIGFASLDRALYGDVERCSYALRQRLGARLAALQAAAQDGRFYYDAAGGAYCVRELALACGAIPNDYPEVALETLCGGVFDGNVPAGGSCNTLEECMGDATCDWRGPCVGVCEPLVRVGGPCAGSSDCSGFGLYGAYCDAGTCTAITRGEDAPLGAACGSRNDGLKSIRLCAEGVCSDASGGHEFHSGCALPLPLGERCGNAGRLCEAGAYCVSTPEGYLCQTRTLAKEEGAACDDAVLCDALEHLSCVDGVCVTMGDGLEGSWCLPGAQSGCREGTRCQPGGAQQGTCEVPRDVGVAASSPSECATDTLDNAEPSTCAPRYCSTSPYAGPAR